MQAARGDGRRRGLGAHGHDAAHGDQEPRQGRRPLTVEAGEGRAVALLRPRSRGRAAEMGRR